MPAPRPAEFRRRAVEPARTGSKPVRELARGLGNSGSCLRNWLAPADTDDGGPTDRLTRAKQEELAELRRRNRQLEMDNEVSRRRTSPEVAFRLVHELAADGIDDAVSCRPLGDYYEWKDRPLLARDADNGLLLQQIRQFMPTRGAVMARRGCTPG